MNALITLLLLYCLLRVLCSAYHGVLYTNRSSGYKLHINTLLPNCVTDNWMLRLPTVYTDALIAPNISSHKNYHFATVDRFGFAVLSLAVCNTYVEALQHRYRIFNDRFYVIFSLPSTCSVSVTFTATEHASAQNVVQHIYPSFAAFTNRFSQNHIYLMFKSIVSRILNILLNKYWKKKKKMEWKMPGGYMHEECKQTELISICYINTPLLHHDLIKK